MKKRLLHILTRLTLLSVLMVLFGTTAADADILDEYYDGWWECDSRYYPDLQDCRETPGYPDNPSEGQCRYTAANQWSSCVNELYPASPEEADYCVYARLARDHCYGQYGPNGADPDLFAYMVCYESSGVSNCE